MDTEIYQTTKETLEKLNVPEDLADVASKIIATDDPSKPNLGRSAADTEICRQVVEIINQKQPANGRQKTISST